MSAPAPQTLWILSDAKPGHENQSLAIAEALGAAPTVHRLWYGKDARFYLLLLLAYLSQLPVLGPALARLVLPSLAGRLSPVLTKPATPILCLAAGTLPLPLLVLLRRAWGVRACAVMAWRPFPQSAFDLVIRHQLGGAAERSGQILVLGAPARRAAIQTVAFEQEVQDAVQGRPALAVMLGGPLPWQGGSLQPFLDIVSSLPALPYPSLITTSRRSPQALEDAIAALPPAAAPFRLLAGRQPGNPIPAFLKHARLCLVSGESISMISECLNAGAAVVVVKVWDAPPQGRGQKFAGFLNHLAAQGYVTLADPHTLPAAIEHALATPAAPFPASAAKAAAALTERGLWRP